MFLFDKIVVIRYGKHIQGFEAEQAGEAEAGNIPGGEDKRSGGILTDKTTLSIDLAGVCQGSARSVMNINNY